MLEEKKNVRAMLICAFAGIVMVLAYLAFRPSVYAGFKLITLNVDHKACEDTNYTIRTKAEYLSDALEEVELISGEEGPYGLWITTVDGETADADKDEWWSFNVNGALGQYGADSQPVNDGDVYDFKLNTGY